MVQKCYHHDIGFCRYQGNCTLRHFEGVCREPNCRNRRCLKRHPKPCRNFFLKNFCRFGQDCKYDHHFSCEGCANLKNLMDIEIEKSKEATKYDKLISKIKNELSEAKKEIKNLKDEKQSFVRELSSLKKEHLKKDDIIKIIKNENENHKLEAEKNLNFGKTALEKLDVMVSKLEKENLCLKSTIKDSEKELKVVNMELKTLKEKENKITEENKKLKAKTEERKEPSDEFLKEEHEEQLKLKDMEIKSLMFTRKVCVDNASKLQKTNINLEKEIKDLKQKIEKDCTESVLPYPCDKCDLTYKTAGLLVRHVRKEHQNLPGTRP